MASSLLATALGLRGRNPDNLDEISINPTKIQERTIAGNIANAPEAFRLADLSNTFSTEQLLKSLEAILPGYGTIRDTITSIVGGKLRGEIPRDVRNLLERNAAEKGIAMGTSGSDFNEYDELRNLGLTSLGIQNEGLSQASAWLRSQPQPAKFDFTSMFFTPQQRLSFEFEKAKANKEIEWLNHQIDALPSNLERAAAGFLDFVATTGLTIASAYTGGMFDAQGSGVDAAQGASDAGNVGSGYYGRSGMSGMQQQEQSGGGGGIMDMLGGMGGMKGMGSGGFI